MVPATGVLVFDYSKPPGAASGGAGLVSTTHDYARFTQMILNGGQLDGVRIISPLALKQYMSNHLADRIRDQPDEPFQTSSGVGFAVDTAIVVDPAKAATLQGLGTISWSGAAGTWFWIDPANDLYCVGMMQVMDRGRDPSLANIEPESSALLYSALVDPRK
jgi:CubicO group peptidase (beta-lactamase class C family)